MNVVVKSAICTVRSSGLRAVFTCDTITETINETINVMQCLGYAIIILRPHYVGAAWVGRTEIS